MNNYAAILHTNNKCEGSNIMNKGYIVLGLILVLVFVCLFGLYLYFVPIPKEIAERSVWIQFLSMLIAAYGVTSSAIISVYSSIDRKMFDIMENTFKMIDRWDSPSLKDARRETIKIKKIKPTISDTELIKRIDGEEVKEVKDDKDGKEDKEVKDSKDVNEDKKCDECTELRISVSSMFNFFEEIYLSIQHKRIKERLIKNAFGETYIDIFNRFNAWTKKNLDEVMMSHLTALKIHWEQNPMDDKQ